MLDVAVAVSKLCTTCACVDRCLLSSLCGLYFHFPHGIIKYDCWTPCCRSWKRASTMACSARLSTARLASSLTRSVASETIRSVDLLGTWRYVIHWCRSVGCEQYVMRHLSDSLPFGSLSMYVRCDLHLWAKGKHSQHFVWISGVKTYCRLLYVALNAWTLAQGKGE